MAPPGSMASSSPMAARATSAAKRFTIGFHSFPGCTAGQPVFTLLSEGNCRQAIPAPGSVGGDPLGAEDGGVAARDRDYDHPGQLTRPEEGPGLKVQPSRLE